MCRTPLAFSTTYRRLPPSLPNAAGAYDLWAEQGYLGTTPGASISYEFIAERLKDVFEDYQVTKIAFDRWNYPHLRPWLVKVGFSEQLLERTFVEFGQGFKSMSPALRDLESLVLGRKLRHGNHPVLTMCMANAVVERDAAGNRKLSKKRSSGRIDGAVALAMAIAAACGLDGQGGHRGVDRLSVELRAASEPRRGPRRALRA